MAYKSHLNHGEVVQSLQAMISCKALKTQEAYFYSLNALAEFGNVKPDSYAFERFLVTFTPAQATQFLTFLRSRRTKDGSPLSDNTIALRASILRKVFGHLIDIGARVGNPIAIIRGSIPFRQRVQKRPTKLIPFNLVNKLMDLPDPKTKEGIRDRALLAVLFGGGLRRSEVYKLNMTDIDYTPDGTPFLVLKTTKAGVNQTQSLPAWAWARLLRYLEQRDADGDIFRGPLFIFYYKDGCPGRRLCDRTIARIYRRYAKDAGIANAAPHSARATACTMLKELGYEDRDCAEFLRHANTNMVRAYDKRARGPARNPGRKLSYGTALSKDLATQSSH